MHKNANANTQCHYIMGLNIMQDKYRGYVDKWGVFSYHKGFSLDSL